MAAHPCFLLNPMAAECGSWHLVVNLRDPDCGALIYSYSKGMCSKCGIQIMANPFIPIYRRLLQQLLDTVPNRSASAFTLII
jgi:hypothetical protein